MSKIVPYKELAVPTPHHVSYINRINTLRAAQPALVAGQLKFHAAQWREITNDLFGLSCVSGCAIEFDHEQSLLPHISKHQEYQFSLAERQAFDKEIAEFVTKNIITKSKSMVGEVISPIFIRPKKNLVNFASFSILKLNEGVTYHKFKMGMLETAIKTMTPGCFMNCIDLRDAYYAVPILTSSEASPTIWSCYANLNHYDSVL